MTPDPTEQQLLKTLLEPLLADFQYWFERAKAFLESERVSFLSDREQSDLLQRVLQAQQEVAATQALFKVLNQEVGVEMGTLLPWHHLVTECWQVSRRFRAEQQGCHFS